MDRKLLSLQRPSNAGRPTQMKSAEYTVELNRYAVVKVSRFLT
jgi:hypothetical protein